MAPNDTSLVSSLTQYRHIE